MMIMIKIIIIIILSRPLLWMMVKCGGLTHVTKALRMNVMNHLKTDAKTKGESDEDDQPRESGEQPAAQADPVLSFFC